jgi:hypothetical protein
MYVCSEHGETWHAELVEEIDTDHDEVYQFRKCPKCHHEVKPLLHDGHPVMHPLTQEEAYWESWSDDEEEEAGWGEGTCRTCGGEHGDGWSNCTCDMEDE